VCKAEDEKNAKVEEDDIEQFDESQRTWRNAVPCKFHALGTCKKGRGCPFSHNTTRRHEAPKPPANANLSGKYAQCGYHEKRRLKAHLYWDAPSQTWNCDPDNPESLCIKTHGYKAPPARK
jgi:hypothetical protein